MDQNKSFIYMYTRRYCQLEGSIISLRCTFYIISNDA